MENLNKSDSITDILNNLNEDCNLNSEMIITSDIGNDETKEENNINAITETESDNNKNISIDKIQSRRQSIQNLGNIIVDEGVITQFLEFSNNDVCVTLIVDFPY